MTRLTRRSFLALAGAACVTAPILSSVSGAAASVLVVGGGSGGAAAALEVKRQLPSARVTLLERDPAGLAKPRRSVLGTRPAVSFQALSQAGINVSVDEAVGVDWGDRRVHGVSGRRFDFDRMVLAPGVGLHAEQIDGYDARTARLMPHAWLRGGTDASILERRLAALPWGATVVVRLPDGAVSHRHGAYVRATEMARRLPMGGKVILLDGAKSFAEQARFEERWAAPDLSGRIERVGRDQGGRVLGVRAEENTLITEAGPVKADLINFIPAQRAGVIADMAGLTDASGWCPVEGANGRSLRRHTAWVVGDAAALSGPKSAVSAERSARRAATDLITSV